MSAPTVKAAPADSSSVSVEKSKEFDDGFNRDAWPKWELLRLVGNSYAVKLTVLVPFIGYLLLFNDTLVKFFALQILTEGKTESAPEQINLLNLRLLYFGLLFVGVGSILYLMFCPSVIKSHAGSTDFVRAELEHATYKHIRDLLDYCLEVYPNNTWFKDLKQDIRYGRKKIKSIVSDMAGWGSAPTADDGVQADIVTPKYLKGSPPQVLLDDAKSRQRDAYIRVMRYYYNVERRASPLAFWLALGCFVVGFAMLTIPSVRTAWKILQSVF